MEKNLQDQEANKKLKELIESVRFCMLATVDTANNLYGRPMTTMQIADDGTIWFFTSDNTESANKAEKNDTVCLNYAHPPKNTYITVQGRMELVKDKKKMEELWNPTLKAYFPKGLEEQDIALLKITPTQAHYWDADASRLVLLFSLVKAAITGERGDLGDQGDLKIN